MYQNIAVERPQKNSMGYWIWVLDYRCGWCFGILGSKTLNPTLFSGLVEIVVNGFTSGLLRSPRYRNGSKTIKYNPRKCFRNARVALERLRIEVGFAMLMKGQE
jgi:hypothetical protein